MRAFELALFICKREQSKLTPCSPNQALLRHTEWAGGLTHSVQGISAAATNKGIGHWGKFWEGDAHLMSSSLREQAHFTSEQLPAVGVDNESTV